MNNLEEYIRIIEQAEDKEEVAKALSALTENRIPALKIDEGYYRVYNEISTFIEAIDDEELLGELSVRARLAEIRSHAVDRLEDERLLSRVIMNEISPDILEKAFDKVYDRDIWQEIARNAGSIDVRFIAEDILRYGFRCYADATDGEPIHMGSISERGEEVSVALGSVWADKRIEAVRSIDDQTILKRIASKDNRPEVQREAIEKITDCAFLRSVIEDTDDEDVLNTAIKAYYINDPVIKVEYSDYNDQESSPEIASKATDQKLLLKILNSHEDFDTRKAAYERIWDKELLREFVRRDQIYGLRDQYYFIDEAHKNILLSENLGNSLALEGDLFAVRQVIDPEILIKIVDNGTLDNMDRINALWRLTDKDKVQMISKSTCYSHIIRNEAAKKLVRSGLRLGKSNTKKLREVIDNTFHGDSSTENDFELAMAAIEELDDEKTLFELAMEDRGFPFHYMHRAGYIYCIGSIIQKIYNPEYLFTIATRSPRIMHRNMAMERLDLDRMRQVMESGGISAPVRETYVRKENDQSILGNYAMKDPEDAVRQRAVYRITDNNILSGIVMYCNYDNIRRIALSLMSDPGKIFMIACNARETWLRKTAVQHRLLTDTKYLSEIALEDNNYFVCLAALDKIDDQRVLKEIALNTDDRLIRYESINKIDDEDILINLYKKTYHEEAREQLIKRISDNEFLFTVALDASVMSCAGAAAERMTDEGLCYKLVKESDNNDIRYEVLGHIKDTDLLTDIYYNEKDIGIREAAGAALFGEEFYRNEAPEDFSDAVNGEVYETSGDEVHTNNAETEEGAENESDMTEQLQESPMLKYATRANSYPSGKQNIYFSACTEDHVRYSEKMFADILAFTNSAIWYLEPGTEIDEELLFNELSQMQLFVFPITSEFLNTDNPARNRDFAYAKKHRKAILPVIMEEGLEYEFNRVCGELHTLNALSNDVTAASYNDKLNNYLNSIIVGEEFADRIRKAFDAYIFISYRKKDRAYAHELMKLLHANEFCRDVALWYDEFLVPGLDFNEAIYNALNKSQIFAMVVTPNIVNEKNYIMTTEYPFARKLDKDVFPFVMKHLEESEKEALLQKFDAIGECIDPLKEVKFKNDLKRIIGKTAISSCRKDALHDFFIGLAYLKGIDVEIDHERALGLITSAADRNVEPGLAKLVQMYRYGDGVAMDRKQMLDYQRKLVIYLEGEYTRESSSATRRRFICALHDLADYLTETEEARVDRETSEDAEKYLKRALYLCRAALRVNKDEWAQNMLIVSIRKLAGAYAMREDWTEAARYFNENLTILQGDSCRKTMQHDEINYNLGVTYMQLGRNALQENSLFLAQDYFGQAVLLFEDLFNKKRSMISKQGMTEAWKYLGDSYKDDNRQHYAQRSYTRALHMSKALYEEYGGDALKLQYEKLKGVCDAVGVQIF